MATEFIYQILIALFFAGATYGAIRQDIKNIHRDLDRHEIDINEAHERIDTILLKGHEK